MSNLIPLIMAAGAAAVLLGSNKKGSKSSGPGPLPPQEDLEFDESQPLGPDGEPIPIMGNPYRDPCLKAVWGGNHRIDGSVLKLMTKRARAVVTPHDGRWTWVDSHGNVHRFSRGITYLKPLYQNVVFKSAIEEFSKNRQIISLAVRDILKKIMPNCNWDVDIKYTPGSHSEYMTKDQYNLWLSVWHLVTAASRQNYKAPYRIGGRNPRGNLIIPDIKKTGLIVGRGYVNISDLAKPGNFSLAIGQRVELVVGEYRRQQLPYPPMYHSERVYAYAVGSSGGAPIVEILDRFNNKDVYPKFSDHHGFIPGQRIHLNSKTTTGIRRIFKQGIE